MSTIYNEVVIEAPVRKIWQVLATPELLERYDPTVRKSFLISNGNGMPGVMRRVEMIDGKNWFEEKMTVYKQDESLTYELTACSFPVHNLKHSYSFQELGERTKVTQVMEYSVKFGFLGMLLDALVMRKQSDNGIKKFLAGLKSYVEAQ
jgi:ligand-binding SRPBCC domain-containing protein